jgi:hypothetical protein
MKQNYNTPQTLPNLTDLPTVTIPFHPDHLPLLEEVGIEYSVRGKNEIMSNFLDIVMVCDEHNCLALFDAGFRMSRRAVK